MIIYAVAWCKKDGPLRLSGFYAKKETAENEVKILKQLLGYTQPEGWEVFMKPLKVNCR